jgi:DASS family divalent anion:Na+ symporter
MSEWNALTDALLAEPAFRQCPAGDLARLLAHAHLRTLASGDVLHARDAEAEETYLVVDGAFAVQGATGGGTAVTAGFLGEESAIGLGRYLATVTATAPSRVAALPRAAFGQITRHEAVRQHLLSSYGARFSDRPAATADPAIAAKPGTTEPSMRVVIGWLCAVLVPAALLWWFTEHRILPNLQSVYLMAIIGVAVVMWVFRLLPDFLPALFAVLCVLLLGLAPAGVALGGFASNTFFMALSIFGLSTVITVSGLSYRVLLWLLRIGPEHKAWYNASLFITGMALTPVVPTTNGRVAILSPFFTDLLHSMDRDSARAEAPRMSASLMGGVSLMSTIFLSSKSVNFLIFGLLPLQEQERFQWLYWFYAASVCGLIMLALYGLGLWLLFRNGSRPAIPRALVADQMRILGPMKLAEWSAVTGLAVLLLSFVTATLHHIEIPWVALAILFSLLMFNFLSPKDFRERIDWTFLIFLGALVGLVATMEFVGFDAWLGQQLVWLRRMMSDDLESFILMLAAAIFIVRLALPINATVVIFATLLVPTAALAGVNPWLVGFLVLLLSENFIWPYQASYYLQFCSQAGAAAQADDRRVLLLNALGFAMKLAAVYASFPFWRHLGIV